MVKKILLGLHDQDFMDAYSITIRNNSYSIYVASTPQIMLKELERSDGEYRRVLMDANFGMPGEVDISPSKKVHELLEPRIKSGEVRFLAVSSNPEAINDLKKDRISAIEKCKLTPEKLEEFLQ